MRGVPLCGHNPIGRPARFDGRHGSTVASGLANRRILVVD
jgi:hypothetical protein